MVAAGFTLQVLSGGLYFRSFGAYFVYLHDEFGWSRTLLAGAFSLARLETGVLGPLQGWLINRIGPRALMTAGMLAFGVGFMLIGRAQMSVEAAAGVVAVVTAMCAVGHVAAGLIGDRLEKRLIATACMGGHTLALVVLMVSTAPALILVFAILHGLSWGLRGALMSAIRADYFGRRSFATIEGYASLITMLGTILGPILVGAVADTLGDYRLGFVCLAVATAAGGVSFFMAGRPGDFLRRHQEASRARAISPSL